MTDPGTKFLEMRQAMGNIGDQGPVNWRKEAKGSQMNFVDRTIHLMKQDRATELRTIFDSNFDSLDLDSQLRDSCFSLPIDSKWEQVAFEELNNLVTHEPDLMLLLRDVYTYKQYILDCVLTMGMDIQIQDARGQLVLAEKSVQEYVKSHPDKFTVDQKTGVWKSIYFGKDLSDEE